LVSEIADSLGWCGGSLRPPTKASPGPWRLDESVEFRRREQDLKPLMIAATSAVGRDIPRRIAHRQGC
jgi:hypothetical protein